MLEVMNDPAAEAGRRDRMAFLAAPYVHGKAMAQAALGKKGQQAEAARDAAAGLFAPPAPPPGKARVN